MFGKFRLAGDCTLTKEWSVARTWTPEQAASLAPDAAALKAGQGLSSPRKWTELGGDGDFIWGLAQGSGANPYQVQVDLGEPAFKCSCPSRKFPCKHGLGLLLLFSAQPGALTGKSRPAWVDEWVAKRAEKAVKQEQRATAEASGAAAPDPVQQAKRREKREANVAQGLDFLDGWLRDLARQGLAATATAGYQFWDGPARRLVDAQAPGLARRVRELAELMTTRGRPDEQVLAELGRLHLLVSAGRQRATLPPDWQQEIDRQIGWAADQEEVRQSAGIDGSWFVGAQTVREEDKLVARTTYLFSPEGTTAKLIEFSPAARPSVATLALGRWVEGELVFIPGVQARRALWKNPPRDTAGGTLTFLTACADVVSAHAAALAANPLAEASVLLVRLVPELQGARWMLRDAEGKALPVVATFGFGWEIMACAGGAPLALAGLWDGFGFTPLTVFDSGGARSLTASPAS